MRVTRYTALVLAAIGLFLARPVARVVPPDALPFAKNFLVTGNYVVGSVDLAPSSSGNGTLTGTINMNGVPANADVLAAYLYWETITTNVTQFTGATLRGLPIEVAKASQAPLTGNTAACFSSGGGGGATYTMAMFRGDVLRLLPIQKDASGKPTGRVLVNDADLVSNNLPLTTVTLPEAGTGNQVPSTAGATLFIVYRSPTEPLTNISLYDGIFVQPPGVTMTQTVRGFLQSSASHVAKMTHIVGSGAKNTDERIFFKNSLLATNPFAGSNGPSSDRFWASPTYNVTSLMPGTDANDGYGETVTTSVDHTKTTPYDCLSWAAVIFSTTVTDADGDGMPDKLEDTSGLRDPNGNLLPDLHGMGASSQHKDLFIEAGALLADPGTTYGVGAAAQTDGAGHNHLPTPAVLKMIGDSYKNAPIVNADGSPGIHVHFDMGPAYHLIGPGYASLDADEYIVEPDFARGGELIKEVACQNSASEPCQFPDYPGTVSWKIGYQLYRDAPVDPDGLELSPAAMDACETSPDCRRRFDQNRMNYFHYILYAHARGKPKEACNTGTTAQQDACRATNPDFHVPSTSSGVSDLPGGDSEVTLGFWGHGFVGANFIQASTTMHELGHSMWRTHGGEPLPAIEANCKPNYLSVMSYLFQTVGLRTDDGVAHLDYSRDATVTLNKTALSEGAVPLPYLTSWYVPFGSPLAQAQDASLATRFCNGAPLPNPLPDGWVPMARVSVNTQHLADPIDWNGDGLALGLVAGDINFDGTVTAALLHGSNDWLNLRLDQVGSRRNMGGFSSGIDFTGFLDFDGGIDYTGFLDFDGGIDYTGFMDFGGGFDLGGGIDYTGLVDAGGGIDYTGFLDIGGATGHEMDRTIATGNGNAPANEFKACVLGDAGADGCPAADGATPLHRNNTKWIVPDVGDVTSYSLIRVLGSLTPSSIKVLVGGSAVPPATTSLVDTTEFAHGQQLTYYVRTDFADATKSTSNTRTITAVNDAPVAIGETYAVNAGASLTIAARGVLTNDTDTDSPLASLTAVLDTAPAHAASFSLSADGSFTYTPAAGFAGNDTFKYVAKDVTPVSARNIAATVTITVVDITPPVVTLSIPTPNGLGGYFVTAPVAVTVSATDPSNVSSFTCTDNGTVIAVGSLAGIGTSSASGQISLGADGTHSLECKAKDGVNNFGAAMPGSSNTGTVKIDTTPPTIAITRAANNANYVLKATVTASFSCSDPNPASGIASCIGSVANNANIDTNTVGPKSFTVTAKDVAGNQATATNNYLVVYNFVLSSIKPSAQLGSAVPLSWLLKDALGNNVSSLSTLVKMESVFNGAAGPSGCSAASATGTHEIIYNLPIGATGGSDFRLSSGGYTFNWDSSTAGSAPIVTGTGCYTVLLTFNDGSAARLTTPVQLK